MLTPFHKATFPTMFLITLMGCLPLFAALGFQPSTPETSRTAQMNDLIEQANKTIGDHPQHSATLAKEAYALSVSLDDLSAQANVALILSMSAYRQGIHQQAMDWALKALDINQRLAHINDIGLCQRRLANISCELGHIDLGISFFLQSIDSYREYGDKDEQATSWNHLGLRYWRMGEKTKAIHAYRQALTLWTETDNKASAARCHNNLGVVFYNSGRYEEALKHYHQSLAIRQSLGYAHTAVIVMNNIGLTLYKAGQPSAAETTIENALCRAMDTANLNAVAYAYHNLATINEERGEYHAALETYRASKQYYNLIQHMGGMALAENGIGTALLHFGLFEEARTHFEAARLLGAIGNNTVRQAEARHNIGLSYLKQGQPAKARESLEESLLMARAINQVDLEQKTSLVLSQCLSEMGHYQEALLLFQQHQQTHQRLVNEEIAGKIADAQARYTSEKKERENAILRIETADQATQLAMHRLTILIFVGLVILMLGICLFLWRANRHKRKLNQLMTDTNLAIRRHRDKLKDKNRELERAMQQVNMLSGLLPICSHCKKIRDDHGYWEQLEVYLDQHSEAQFSHGICPDCATIHYPDYLVSKSGKSS